MFLQLRIEFTKSEKNPFGGSVQAWEPPHKARQMGIAAKFIILIQVRKEAAAERQQKQRCKVYGRRDRERDSDRKRRIKRSNIGGREIQGGGSVGMCHVFVQC